MKANHNNLFRLHLVLLVVSSGSKILKWKQITTNDNGLCANKCCFQWFKDTKMKANHNHSVQGDWADTVVSSGSKILKWKQITTPPALQVFVSCCFQWFKDTKMKANHNLFMILPAAVKVVSSGSKILKWKQITTPFKAARISLWLFPVVQRY